MFKTVPSEGKIFNFTPQFSVEKRKEVEEGRKCCKG
jgi:hypothetical protein